MNGYGFVFFYVYFHRVFMDSTDYLLMQFEDPSTYKDKVVATGLPASPGAAVGQIVFSADAAEAWHAQGKSVILVSSYSYILQMGLLRGIEHAKQPFKSYQKLTCESKFYCQNT